MRLTVLFVAVALVFGLAGSSRAEEKKAASIYDFKVDDIDGKPVELSKYKGQVLLVVNVASRCGNTPQYKPLQAIYEEKKEKGLRVLGFPANEFGKQEPGSNADIKEFCTSTYKVTFDMFSKIVVKGEGQHPLYKYLTSKETNPDFGGDIEWNFAKFLIDRDGKIIARFPARMKPDSKEVLAAIDAALAKEAK